MNKYIKVILSAGFCGTETEEYYAISEDLTTSLIDEVVGEIAHDWGESYSNLIEEVYPEDYDSKEEYEEALAQAEEDFYANCSGDWYYVTKEEWKENNGRTW